MSCNELIEWIIHMSIHLTDGSIQPHWLNIWAKQPELIARCLVGCTEWEFASQNAMRVCIPFSYFYCFSHLSIYLPLPSMISLQYFSMVLLDVSSTIFCKNTILITLTPFFLNAHLVRFCFPTLYTFCWIASHILLMRLVFILDQRSSLLPLEIIRFVVFFNMVIGKYCSLFIYASKMCQDLCIILTSKRSLEFPTLLPFRKDRLNSGYCKKSSIYSNSINLAIIIN